MMDWPSHEELLELFCRVCGRPASMENSSTIYPVDLLANLIKVLHEVDVVKEDPAMYPKRICQQCSKKALKVDDATGVSFLKSVIRYAEQVEDEHDDEKLLRMSREFPLADFWAHQTGACQVRLLPNYH
jgi:hypothetical protein